VTVIPSQEILCELLLYFEECGSLFWQERGARWFEGNARFQPEAAARMWNGRNAGCEAFRRKNAKGYKVGCLLGRQFLAHRIIWRMVFDEDPETVDHINGDPSDNRLANLRNVSMADQCRNKSTYITNRHGKPGVAPAAHGRWRAHIWYKGKQHHLGMFGSKAEAIAARDLAERQYRYHENHGRTNRG